MTKPITKQFNAQNFDFKKFEDKYRGNDPAALKALQKIFPLDIDATPSFADAVKTIMKSDLDLCAGYMGSLAIFKAIEKRIAERPNWYKNIGEMSIEDMLERFIHVETPMTGPEVWPIRNIVWALGMKHAPAAEKYAFQNSDREVLRGITFGMITDYRRRKYSPERDFAVNAEAYKRTSKALKDSTKKHKPLKRK